MENFIEIPDTEGNYLINHLGQVYSLKSKKILKYGTGNSGYPQMVLRVKGKTVGFSVHRLVAQAFIPNPHNARVVNHINGNKADFSISNLEWCSHSENRSHAIKTGLSPKPPTFKGKFGAAHNRSKKVYVYRIDGSLEGQYGSAQEAARMTEANPVNVQKSVLAQNFSRSKRLLYSYEQITAEQVIALSNKSRRLKTK